MSTPKIALAATLAGAGLVLTVPFETARGVSSEAATAQVMYKTVPVDGLSVFYREAGPSTAPVVLLLHGFPTSSHMFRNLIPLLADRFRVIAPDYPGFGNSAMPAVDEFDYTFDNLALVVERFTEQLGLSRYALYLQDYGAPIGFRLAAKHPQRVEALVIQNGNAYEEGLGDFWKPFRAYWQERSEENAAALRKFLELDATKWQYTHGVRRAEAISPDNWLIDQVLLDRPGNKDIQLQLFYSYGANLARYPEWQAYFRRYQPPALIVWGSNDRIFPVKGAHAYKQDLKDLETHLLDTGHFALEEDHHVIGKLMRQFLEKHEKPRSQPQRPRTTDQGTRIR